MQSILKTNNKAENNYIPHQQFCNNEEWNWDQIACLKEWTMELKT